MIVVYDMRQRAQFLADVRRKHDGKRVIARNPRYWRGETDREPSATLVYLCQEHPEIQASYAAHGVEVICGASLTWGDPETPQSMPVSHDPSEPDITPLIPLQIVHEGRGWYQVYGTTGQPLTEKAVRREEAERLLSEAAHG